MKGEKETEMEKRERMSCYIRIYTIYKVYQPYRMYMRTKMMRLLTDGDCVERNLISSDWKEYNGKDISKIESVV